MGNLTFLDSAYPMGAYPAADGFCFYIGGDTPHVWSSAEVAVLKQHYRYLLPIYVRSNPPGPGAAADVAACVAQLRSLGAPAGTLVSWDSETAVDAPYIQSVYADLRAAGYVLIEYASQSVVFAEGNPDGYYWGADWTNVSHLHSGDVVTQYVSYSGYDESLASSSLPFWDTRGGPVNPYPIISAGATGAPVSTAQTRLNVWHAAPVVAVDGSFGPATTTAVKSFQTGHAPPADGTVGPVTWTALNATPVAPLVAGQLPAPTALVVDHSRVALGWHAVTGTGLTGYTATAYGIDGKAYASTTTPVAQPWCVLNGLAPGGTYTIKVWANGGSVAPLGTQITVTLPT